MKIQSRGSLEFDAV